VPRSVLIHILLFVLATSASATELTVGYISRSPEIPYVWNSSNPAVEGWPQVGSPVTWRAHVRSWFDTPKTVAYVWKLNGNEIARGTTTLAANAYATVDLQRPWSFTRERLSFTIDSANAVGEESESNNRLEVFTDALAVGFFVEQSVYDHFRANQPKLGIGSTSFEDYAQRLIETQNDMFALAVYDLTPQGVRDRWRLQKLVVVPDGALPLTPPANERLGNEPSDAATQPDASDRSIDIQWGWPATVVSAYDNYEASGPSNSFHIGGVLLHEMGHARYLMDIYAFDVRYHPPTNTIEVDGVPTSNGFAFWTPEQGLMNRNYTFIDRHSAVALNRIAGHRAIAGNYNDPENVGSYMNDLPAENRLTIYDAEGNLLRDWNIEIFQSKLDRFDWWYPTHYEGEPDLRLRTDANGQVFVGRNPFSANGPVVSYWRRNNTVALIRAERNGVVKFGFLESRVFNLAYWSGQTALAEHELVVGRDTPCGFRGPTLVSPAWDTTSSTPSMTFTWRTVRDAVSYKVYTASPSHPQPRLLGTTTGTALTANVTGGRAYWWVEATFANSCPALRSDSARFTAPAGSARRRSVR
jgi:hypothetical protein